jgi:hypothetical protein
MVANAILKAVSEEEYPEVLTLEEFISVLKRTTVYKDDIDRLEKSFGVLTKISSMIKHNKIEFKYGLFPIDRLRNKIFKGFNFEGTESNYVFKSDFYVSNIHIAGLANIDGIDIIQCYNYKLDKVFYGLFFNDLMFKEYPNMTTLKEVKIVHALRSWQGLQNTPNDKDLYFLKHIGVPLKYRQCKNPLYRGLKLSGPGATRLRKGLSINLQDRMFSSWSESKESALNFGIYSSKRKTGVIMTYNATKEVLINIEDFSTKVFAPSPIMLLTHEHEVILVNSPKMLKVSPDQVEFMVRSDEHVLETVDHKEFLNRKMVAHAILKAVAEDDEEYALLSSIKAVRKVIPILVKSAQRVYNHWNEKNIDTYAGGGICHLIADKFCDILNDQGISCSTVSSDHEQHVFTVVQVKEGIYKVDIHPSVYETGGGFTWKKIKHVKFSNEDVYLYKISSNPEEFDEYIGD